MDYSTCVMAKNTVGGDSLITRRSDFSHQGNMVSNKESMCSKTYKYTQFFFSIDLHKICCEINQLELKGEDTFKGKNKVVCDALEINDPPYVTRKGSPKRLK